MMVEVMMVEVVQEVMMVEVVTTAEVVQVVVPVISACVESVW